MQTRKGSLAAPHQNSNTTYHKVEARLTSLESLPFFSPSLDVQNMMFPLWHLFIQISPRVSQWELNFYVHATPLLRSTVYLQLHNSRSSVDVAERSGHRRHSVPNPDASVWRIDTQVDYIVQSPISARRAIVQCHRSTNCVLPSL